MTDMPADPIEPRRLFFPALAGLYRRFSPFSYAFMRFGTGAVLVPHGAQKLFAGTVVGTAAGIAQHGWPAPLFWAYVAACVEFFGAICLALGLFTRLAALLIWIEMSVIIVQFQWQYGYFWTNRGIEYALLWWLLIIAIFFRGGGRYSLDRVIGREF